MRYYETQRRGLGIEFSRRVDATVERIRKNPDAGAPLSVKVRRRFIEGFPYEVIYRCRPAASASLL
jgi:hypothetical protein